MRSEIWTVLGFKRCPQFAELGNDMLKVLLQSIIGRFSPTISPVPDKVASNASVHAPTIADHLQYRQSGQLDRSVRDRIAIECFNAWHVRAGTGIRAKPIGTPSNPIAISAEEALASASENAGERSALADSENFLRIELANGPRDAKSLKTLANAAGIAWRTIERAKKRLGVQAEKSKTAHGGWTWALSSNASASVEGRQVRQHRHSPGAEEDGGIRKNGELRQQPPSEILGGLGEHVNATIAADNP